jgi:hypothetical protein
VPEVEPAVTLRMNVRELLAGIEVAGKVQEIVPLAPIDGEEVGAPSVPPPLPAKVKPAGSVSVMVETVIAAAAGLVMVRV